MDKKTLYDSFTKLEQDTDATLHQISDLKSEVEALEQEGFLTDNTYHIDGQLLCVPLDDLSADEEIALYKRVRLLDSESIEIAPLGTAEQYAILYDLSVYSYDRSE